jgi:hypothetical protein
MIDTEDDSNKCHVTVSITVFSVSIILSNFGKWRDLRIIVIVLILSSCLSRTFQFHSMHNEWNHVRISHLIFNMHLSIFVYNFAVSKVATWSVSNSKPILLQWASCWPKAKWSQSIVCGVLLFADKLEALGLEPMLIVLQKLGLSTSSVPPSGQPFDWLETVGQAQRMLGLNIMVGFWVSQDVRNTSRNLMVVSSWPSISQWVYLSTYSSVHTLFLTPWLCSSLRILASFVSDVHSSVLFAICLHLFNYSS